MLSVSLRQCSDRKHFNDIAASTMSGRSIKPKREKIKIMLKVFKGVTDFYGNGTVYITDGENGVQKLEKHNYEIKALKDNGDEIHISSGVVVALAGYTNLPDAIRELRLVAKRMRTWLVSNNDMRGW